MIEDIDRRLRRLEREVFGDEEADGDE